jgi:hypothetical protein
MNCRNKKKVGSKAVRMSGTGKGWKQGGRISGTGEMSETGRKELRKQEKVRNKAVE